jgi:hypothetical protein
LVNKEADVKSIPSPEQQQAVDLACGLNLTLGWRAADPTYPYDGTVTLGERAVREIIALAGVHRLDQELAQLQAQDRRERCACAGSSGSGYTPT